MYCANCGAKNEDGAKFCLKCGHSLKEEPTPTPNPPFPNPPKPHGNGKAILKLIGTISVELVVLVLLIFGAYKILDNRFSPKTIATDYWKATADCEWSEAYDYCDFPESTFLTKELYVAANADNTEPIHYKSLTIKSSNQMDYEDYNEYLYNLKDQDQKTYYVQYRKRGADNRRIYYADKNREKEISVLERVESCTYQQLGRKSLLYHSCGCFLISER